jgi:Zn-dependent protease
VKCKQCSAETYMPFKCPYCGHYFCVEHRLPENHNCSEYWRVSAPREQSARTLETAKTEPSYQHTITMMPLKRQDKAIWFSATELKHLAVGTLLVTGVGASLFMFYSSLTAAASLAAVLTFSFLIHEIAHKIAAQRLGLWAEFRLTTIGALITLISIFAPLFKIISPGAVMIAGLGDRETIGKTAFAGPLTNITLATLFLIAGLISIITYPNQVLVFIAVFGAWINSFIAVFNLIPFGIMDGYKIFKWNKIMWASSFSVSIVLAIFSLIFLTL